MKFVKEISLKGALLPLSVLKLCGFAENEKVEFHTGANTLVLLKRQMTAMELIQAVDSLTSLSARLLTYLMEECGSCEECGGESGCPCAEYDYIELPDDLREKAGFQRNTKLCAAINEEEGTVTLSDAGYKWDMRDVPPGLLAVLVQNGICLGELEERLMTEDTIYG